MVTRIAWLLNLDAELELEDPRHYAMSSVMEARIAQLRQRMTLLIDADDLVIGRDVELSQGALALAFCPTPHALARIVRAGLAAPAAPSVAQLARVNGRAFCAELGQTLPGARYVRSLSELLTTLQEGARSATSFLLKRDFGFAGRERRRVFGSELDPSTLGFARRSFARKQGLQVEPWLDRTQDLARHGFVFPSGQFVLGDAMGQHCDAHGSWQSSRPLLDDELLPAERKLLELETVKVAEALAREGYFGPFGVDAFRYLDRGDQLRFQPRSEINARFSMGYPRGLLELALSVPHYRLR
ncbi:MAG: uncharacterized protein JWN48_1185 [Myxococcaceae bacterium]|nr:uncharacterized protein [Myxococcaceae bacterium]